MPATLHVRTTPVENAFSRRQSRRMTGAVDRLVFISESVRARFERLAGPFDGGTTIYNIVEPLDEATQPHAAIPADGRFKVAALSNFAWLRGTDRIVETAVALAQRGRRDVLFVVAGDMHLHGQLPALDAIELVFLQLEFAERFLDLFALDRDVGRKLLDRLGDGLGDLLAEIGANRDDFAPGSAG